MNKDPRVGIPLSEERKQKIRDALKKKFPNGRPLNSGNFKKGTISPRKGKPLGWIGHAKPHTEESKEKMRLNASIRFGKDNNKWKGDDVGNVALHSWVKKQLGFPNKCEFCGFESENHHKIHWANKSHEYKREVTDWLRLCVPCHKKYDLSFIINNKVV